MHLSGTPVCFYKNEKKRSVIVYFQSNSNSQLDGVTQKLRVGLGVTKMHTGGMKHITSKPKEKIYIMFKECQSYKF